VSGIIIKWGFHWNKDYILRCNAMQFGIGITVSDETAASIFRQKRRKFSTV
jgi:hypothetical protein